MLNFWLPMILLFVGATIAAIAARRKRDRCLKYFNHKSVMILMESGKWIWGNLAVYPKALELVFEKPTQDESGHTKASYVLYSPEIDGIRMVLQRPPAAGTKAFKKWQKEINRIAKPSLFRRFSRWIWNIFNTLRDAVSQSLSMVLGTLKTKTSMGKVATADKRAGEIGKTLIETVPNTYEPVLERYLNKRVIVEMLDGGQVIEYAGLLQEYSGEYLLLRNITLQPAIDIGVPLPEQFDVIFPRNKALVRHRIN